MDAPQQESLVDLRAEPEPHRYSLELRPELCGGTPERPFLFGGVALGAAVEALERSCGRPVAWATAQYLSFAPYPSTVTFEVEPVVEGRETSQARVKVRSGDREFLGVSAALGTRSGETRQTWITAPETPPPEDCPPLERHPQFHWNNLPNQFDRRVAPPGPGDRGRFLLWVRHKGSFATDRAMLAVIGDFVSQGFPTIIGQDTFGNSLDNTIRYVGGAATPWVLCDIRLQAATNGMVHGAMDIYAQDGILLAVASQTLILRRRKPGAPE